MSHNVCSILAQHDPRRTRAGLEDSPSTGAKLIQCSSNAAARRQNEQSRRQTENTQQRVPAYVLQPAHKRSMLGSDRIGHGRRHCHGPKERPNSRYPKAARTLASHARISLVEPAGIFDHPTSPAREPPRPSFAIKSAMVGKRRVDFGQSWPDVDNRTLAKVARLPSKRRTPNHTTMGENGQYAGPKPRRLRPNLVDVTTRNCRNIGQYKPADQTRPELGRPSPNVKVGRHQTKFGRSCRKLIGCWASARLVARGRATFGQLHDP